MEPHFQELGLQRGASETDMKKAYHKKALEYHPDRNPHGSEAFKRVHVAYEALQKHYKLHGGVDMVFSGSSSQISEPLLSERELFGAKAYSGGVWGTDGSTPRRYPFRPFRQRDAAAPPTSDGGFAEADVLRAKAHGNRVPVSGYDPFHGEASEMNAFMSQAKHFADMERRKAKLQSQEGHPSDGGPPPPPRPSKPAAAAPESSHQSSRPSSENMAAESSPKNVSRPADKPCNAPLDEEWRHLKQRAAEEERAQQFIHETERQRRKHELEQETREEWSRLQAAMEKEQANQRVREAVAEAAVRIEQQRKTNEQLKSLQREKRELKAQLFSGRMPSSGEIERMSEMELFVMQEVLQQALDRVGAAFRVRMKPALPCCVCGSSPKDTLVERFKCDHKATCTSCGRSLFTCPVCGAENLDLMSDA